MAMPKLSRQRASEASMSLTAMPTWSMRSNTAVSLPEHFDREVAVELGGEREVAHVDALVGPVHERQPVEQPLVALGEEAVGDALRERRAEVARVGEARQDDRHHLRAG